MEGSTDIILLMVVVLAGACVALLLMRRVEPIDAQIAADEPFDDALEVEFVEIELDDEPASLAADWRLDPAHERPFPHHAHGPDPADRGRRARVGMADRSAAG